MSLIKTELNELSLNPFEKVGKDWVLLTAGDEQNYNTMTASWGGMGVMWNKNVFVAVVRPSRYTYSFMEKNDTFSVSMFGRNYRDVLSFCGATSGRDGKKNEKIKEMGLNSVMLDNTPAFDEAEIVLAKSFMFSRWIRLAILTTHFMKQTEVNRFILHLSVK